MKRKVVSVFLTLAMAVGMFSGCGAVAKTDTVGGTDSTESKKPITLTVFSEKANFNGEQVGWISDILKKKFNVKLNIVPNPNGSIFDTRMESKDLGDIIVFGDDNKDYVQARDAGLLYDWNDDDLLADYGPYIKDHMQAALDKNKSLNSDGKVYGMGNDVAVSNSEHSDFIYSWDIRWDLYKQLGYPEVKNLDDLENVFKQMKEICPTDDNGNPTYAYSLWPDWDGNMTMYVKSMASAYYGYDELEFGLYDPTTGTFHDALEENGPYIESMKYFNHLYRDGLIDPDSMTATFDTMIAKVQKGGTFASIFNYAGSLAYNTQAHEEAGKMMTSLKPDDASPIVYGLSTKGSNGVWAIGKNSEYPELAMEVINYLATPEGNMTTLYGPKGLTWDYDKDNNTYFTDLGLKAHKDKANTKLGNGYKGSFHDGELQINNTTWALDTQNPDSNGETYNPISWKSYNEKASSPMEQDWRDHFNVASTSEYFENSKYTFSPGVSFTPDTRSDELNTTYEQVKKCIVDGTWKAIYAKSDDEFNKIVADMTTQAESYGYDKCLEWSKQEAEKRKALESKFDKNATQETKTTEAATEATTEN